MVQGAGADGAPETAPDGEMQAEPETDGAPETDDALAELAGAYITRVTPPEA